MLLSTENQSLLWFSPTMLTAPPAAPRTPSVAFLIPRQLFTITWNEPALSMGGTVDAYFVNISGPNVGLATHSRM